MHWLNDWLIGWWRNLGQSKGKCMSLRVVSFYQFNNTRWLCYTCLANEWRCIVWRHHNIFTLQRCFLSQKCPHQTALYCMVWRAVFNRSKANVNRSEYQMSISSPMTADLSKPESDDEGSDTWSVPTDRDYIVFYIFFSVLYPHFKQKWTKTLWTW